MFSRNFVSRLEKHLHVGLRPIHVSGRVMESAKLQVTLSFLEQGCQQQLIKDFDRAQLENMKALFLKKAESKKKRRRQIEESQSRERKLMSLGNLNVLRLGKANTGTTEEDIRQLFNCEVKMNLRAMDNTESAILTFISAEDAREALKQDGLETDLGKISLSPYFEKMEDYFFAIVENENENQRQTRAVSTFLCIVTSDEVSTADLCVSLGEEVGYRARVTPTKFILDLQDVNKAQKIFDQFNSQKITIAQNETTLQVLLPQKFEYRDEEERFVPRREEKLETPFFYVYTVGGKNILNKIVYERFKKLLGDLDVSLVRKSFTNRHGYLEAGFTDLETAQSAWERCHGVFHAGRYLNLEAKKDPNE